MKGKFPTKLNIDLNQVNAESKTSLSKLILSSEKKYSDQIKEIVEEITNPNSKIKLLLISGPSSAGKTTTSNILRLELSMKNFSSTVISLDNFFIDRDKTLRLPDGSYDFENLKSLDIKYLNKFIDDLLKKHRAKMPVYNFFTGKREKEYVDVIIDDNSMVMIEGLHALNPNLIKDHKKEMYKIYLSLNANFSENENLLIPGKDVRLIRRIVRDIYTRGYSVLETISNWQNVCVGEDKWVKPFKNNVDYVINSVHEYELLLYAKYVKPILKELILSKNVKKLLSSTQDNNKRAVLQNNLEKAKELYYILEKANPISKDLIPSTSLLWEFVGSAEDKVEPTGKIF